MKKLQLILSIAALCLAAGAAQAASYAWVLHPIYFTADGTSSLIKLDARTGAQIGSILFPGDMPTNGNPTVAASPDGRWVAIAGNGVRFLSAAPNDLILIDTATGIAKAISAPSGAQPAIDVAWAPDSSVLYVLSEDYNDGGVPHDGLLYKVDPTAPTLDTYLTLSSVQFPTRLYPSADGRHILITAGATAVAGIVDLATSQVRAIPPSIPQETGVDYKLGGVAAAPDGRYYYAFEENTSGTPYFARFTPGVNAASDQTDTLALAEPGCAGRATAVSPDGRRAYVSNGECTANPGLLVFDLTNFTQLPSITLPGRATAVDVAPSGRTILALMPDLSETAVVDVATGTVTTHPLTDSDGAAISGAYSLIGRGTMIGGAAATTAVAVNPANPQFVYSGTAGAGMFVSSDGGRTWAAASTGLTDLDITALVVTSDGAAVYAGTRHDGVFQSTDNGAHWQALNNGLHLQIRSLVISPNNNQVIYAGVAGGGGVYKTTDGGLSWEAMNDGLP